SGASRWGSGGRRRRRRSPTGSWARSLPTSGRFYRTSSTARPMRCWRWRARPRPDPRPITLPGPSRVDTAGGPWYKLCVYPGVCPVIRRKGGRARDEGHRGARRVLRERPQALQEAVREGGAPLRTEEAAALREAERPAEAQGAGGPQEGEATGALPRLVAAVDGPSRCS